MSSSRRFQRRMTSFAICLALGGTARGEQTLTLQQLIDRATQSSEEMQSLELSLQALDAEIEARDLELTPRLTSEVAYVQDNRRTFNQGRRSLSRFIDISVVKPFSTGTNLTLSTGYEAADVASAENSRQIADWEISLSQSLWRNSFGRATSLRREGDTAEKSSRTWELLSRKQQFLVALEAGYWDLALAVKERQIREANLKRSENLERWVRNRIRRSAAERGDAYQVEALTASRRLDLINVKSRVDAAWNRLRQTIPEVKAEGWQPDTSALERERDPVALLATGQPAPGKEPQRLDALASRFRATQTKAQADRLSDGMRPQLDLVVTHGRNGIEGNFSEAWRQTVGPDSTYTKVGVQFTMDLDVGLQNERRRALQLEADARELEARRLSRDSEVGWEDLRRRVEVLKESITTARELATAQSRNSREEQKRYEQGRSTAFQAIAFEVDAANAELEVYRLLSELRKTEGQSRLFTAALGETP